MVHLPIIFIKATKIMRLGSNLNWSVHLLRMILRLQNFTRGIIIGKNSITHRLNVMVNSAFLFWYRRSLSMLWLEQPMLKAQTVHILLP